MLEYKNIKVEPLRYAGHSMVYKDGENIGLVEAGIDGVSFNVFMYLPSDNIYKHAAHFVWTLYYSDDWKGIYNFCEELITEEHKVQWQKEQGR